MRFLISRARGEERPPSGPVGHGVPGILRVRPQAAQPRRHGGRAGHGGLRRLPARDVAAGGAAAAAAAAAVSVAGGGGCQRRAGAAREAAAAPGRGGRPVGRDREEALQCLVRA